MYPGYLLVFALSDLVRVFRRSNQYALHYPFGRILCKPQKADQKQSGIMDLSYVVRGLSRFDLEKYFQSFTGRQFLGFHGGFLGKESKAYQNAGHFSFCMYVGL